MGFTLSYDEMRVALTIAAGFAGFTIFLSLAILLLSLWIHRTPLARPCIERVSWKLFMVILGIQVVWSTTYLVTYADPDMASRVGQCRQACSTVMVIMMGSRLTVSWLIASIAINLALSVRWNVNSTKRGLTKWYAISSAIAGFTPPIVSAALGHFGGGFYKTCYFTSSTSHPLRSYFLRIFLGFHVWLGLATIVALIAVTISLTSIFTQSRRTSRLIRQSARLSHAALQPDINIGLDEKSLGAYSASRRSSYTCFGRRASDATIRPEPYRRMSMYALDDAFLRIALRVAVYPVVAVILNTFYITTDLLRNIRPQQLSDSYVPVYMAGLVLYAGRGAIFALVAISIDPCFHEGLKAAWKARRSVSGDESHQNGSRPFNPHLRSPLPGTPTRNLLERVSSPPECSFWDMIQPVSSGKHTTTLTPPVSPLMLVVTPITTFAGSTDGYQMDNLSPTSSIELQWAKMPEQSGTESEGDEAATWTMQDGEGSLEVELEPEPEGGRGGVADAQMDRLASADSALSVVIAEVAQTFPTCPPRSRDSGGSVDTFGLRIGGSVADQEDDQWEDGELRRSISDM